MTYIYIYKQFFWACSKKEDSDIDHVIKCRSIFLNWFLEALVSGHTSVHQTLPSLKVESWKHAPNFRQTTK